MARLNKEREERLQPERMDFAIGEISKLDLEIICKTETRIDFEFKGNKIQFFPYSGWHTGKGIKDGRGWKKLHQQLTK